MPEVRCPHCDRLIIDVRRRGHGRPRDWIRPHPTEPTTTQVYCSSCQKLWDLPNTRIAIFKAA